MQTFFESAWETWSAGGWVMLLLLALAVMIAGTGVPLLLKCMKCRFLRVAPRQWIGWLQQPGLAPAPAQPMVHYLNVRHSGQIALRFEEIRTWLISTIQRRLQFLRQLVAAAPILGLLGTVMGMIATFQALKETGANGLDAMAAGISQALITTEAGLVIAIPGYFLVQVIHRHQIRIEAALAQLESAQLQFSIDAKPFSPLHQEEEWIAS